MDGQKIVPVDDDDDWETLISFLPEDWREKGKELGAFKRDLRSFNNYESVLRSLLIHLVDGCSLRETAVRIRVGGIADVTDVALLNRLNHAGEWFRWLATELMKDWMPRLPAEVFPKGVNPRIVDGTHISEPGSTGSNWRIHYSIGLGSLRCDEMKVTTPKIGETFKNFRVDPGDVLVGDRGYSHRAGVEYVIRKEGHVIVRMNASNFPLLRRTGRTFDLLGHLRMLRGTQVGDWAVRVEGKNTEINGRVCAIKKSKVETQRAQRKVMKEGARKGHTVQPATLKAAGYIFVFTTLPKNMATPSAILEIYRGRWQVELVFKRLKSLIALGHLPKQDPRGAKAWIHGKLFAAFLIEALIHAGERFFPWGFPLSTGVK